VTIILASIPGIGNVGARSVRVSTVFAGTAVGMGLELELAPMGTSLVRLDYGGAQSLVRAANRFLGDGGERARTTMFNVGPLLAWTLVRLANVARGNEVALDATHHGALIAAPDLAHWFARQVEHTPLWEDADKVRQTLTRLEERHGVDAVNVIRRQIRE
jgi:non-ribosomal peptide synthetase component F